MNQGMINTINDNLNAIEAMNTFVDDSSKVSTEAIRKALATKDSADIEAAIVEANKIIASGNSYGNTILSALNEAKAATEQAVPVEDEIVVDPKIQEAIGAKEKEIAAKEENIDKPILDNLSAIEAMNTFVDDNNKLSTEAIRKALETKNRADIEAAVVEAEKIKASGNVYGESIYNTLNDIKNSYDEIDKIQNQTNEEDTLKKLEEINNTQQQLEKEQEELINSINTVIPAVEAMNISVDDSNKLSTEAIKKALETKNSADIEAAITEAEKIKASGNTYGDTILQSLNNITVNQVKLAEVLENKSEVETRQQEIETEKQRKLDEQQAQEKAAQEQKEQEQQSIISSISGDVSAVEAMNTFVDDNNKLSTEAIKKALETKNSADIDAAIVEANNIIASGNTYGNNILNNLNKLERNENVIEAPTAQAAVEETAPVTETQEPEVKDENQGKLQEIEDKFYSGLISAEEYETEKNAILNSPEEEVYKSLVEAEQETVEEKTSEVENKPVVEEPKLEEKSAEITSLKNEIEAATKENVDLDELYKEYMNVRSTDIYNELFKLERGNLYNGTNPKYQEQLSAIREKEAEYDKILSEKDTLDFEDAKAVSVWLDKLTPYINTHALALNPGLNVSLESADKYLLSIFAEKGYTPNMESDNSLVETIGKKLNELQQKHYIESEYPNLPDEFLKLNSDKSMALATKNYLEKQVAFNKSAVEKLGYRKSEKKKDENGKQLDEYVLSEEKRNEIDNKIEELKKKIEDSQALIDTLIGEYRLSETAMKVDQEKAKEEESKPTVEETNEEEKTEEFDFTIDDKHKLNNFMPIKAFGKIKKTLYDKITSISFRKSLKTAIEKLKEAKKSVISSSKLKFEKAKDAIAAAIDKVSIKKDEPDVDIDLDKVDDSIATANKVLDSILDAKVVEAPKEEKESTPLDKPDVIVDSSAKGEWDIISETEPKSEEPKQEEEKGESPEEKDSWDSINQEQPIVGRGI